jgi:hypothetical protein
MMNPTDEAFMMCRPSTIVPSDESRLCKLPLLICLMTLQTDIKLHITIVKVCIMIFFFLLMVGQIIQSKLEPCRIMLTCIKIVCFMNSVTELLEKKLLLILLQYLSERV